MLRGHNNTAVSQQLLITDYISLLTGVWAHPDSCIVLHGRQIEQCLGKRIFVGLSMVRSRTDGTHEGEAEAAKSRGRGADEVLGS